MYLVCFSAFFFDGPTLSLLFKNRVILLVKMDSRNKTFNIRGAKFHVV